MQKRPADNIRKCERTLSGVQEMAPGETFGGYMAADFETLVQEMRSVRDEISELEMQLSAVRNRRDAVDAAALKAERLIVNGIVGDRNYGPDSPLYGAVGRKRLSERRSGMRRKKKTEIVP
jgi:hypothetical protein